VESYPESSFDQVMNVNVKGTFLCCQVIGARMATERRGSIVNISSVYGMLSPVQDLYEFRRRGGEEYYKPVAYSVSKSALYKLTRRRTPNMLTRMCCERLHQFRMDDRDLRVDRALAVARQHRMLFDHVGCREHEQVLAVEREDGVVRPDERSQTVQYEVAVLA